MADQTFPVPYRSQLQDKIEPGQSLTIQGQTFEGVDRFHITLHSGSLTSGDMAINIDFRYDEGKVVLNTCREGNWDEKEVREKLKYKPGEAFDVRIRAHTDKYEILLDNKAFVEYEHRLPLTQVNHMTVDGPIILNHVLWGGRYYPVPYEAGIRDGFGPGKQLFVSGKPTGKRFHINLMTDEGDVPLHCNARFDEDKVVRNTQQDGNWQNEETIGKFPFDKKEHFDIIIANERTQFQIYVNNERLCSYAHRMEPEKVAGLQVDGDLELWGIHVMK